MLGDPIGFGAEISTLSTDQHERTAKRRQCKLFDFTHCLTHGIDERCLLVDPRLESIFPILDVASASTPRGGLGRFRKRKLRNAGEHWNLEPVRTEGDLLTPLLLAPDC